MGEVSYAPLSAACVRALTDKMYDKRKAAALEIEKLTRECVAIPNHVQIQKLIKVLGSDFALSLNSNMRKGGLIGLAAMAIALGKETSRYSEDLIRPILTCMSDSDSRVRYYACESLYNVTKVTRENIMGIFNDIFVAMTIVITDLDSSVRTAAELLDKLLKDIVTESDNFTLETFVPVLKDKMYSKDTFARAFTLGWIQAMYKVPNAHFIDHLPEILDPLFLILSDNSPDICTKCEEVLGDFLTDIKAATPSDRIAYSRMINVLATHSQSEHIRLQIMAVQWIHDFIKLSGRQMLPFTSNILVSILPNLAFDDERRRNLAEDDYRRVRDLSNQVNVNLMKLVRSCQRQRKQTLASLDDSGQNVSDADLDLKAILEVLTKQLQRGRVDTKLATLKWIYHLYIIARERMINHVEALFPVLLKTMSDPSDEVVILNLQVLSELCKSEPDSVNPHFRLFHLSLLRLFCADRNLLDSKGSFIIRQLCVLMDSEDIYCCLAEILLQEDTNLKFARLMVETLNTILLTSSELFTLRNRLKELNARGNTNLFVCLYRTWCHSQVATVALCLLSGCYSHASHLVRMISEQEVTMEMLVELDRLIQLIESPIFTSLRMELLDSETSADLIQTLSGLLMIMPQTNAFRLLRDRLTCLPNLQRAHVATDSKSRSNLAINFSELKKHFESVQQKHGRMILAQRSEAILIKSVKILDLSDDENELKSLKI